MRLRNCAVVALGLLALTARADDVTDAIDQARDLYDDGQTQAAITQLEFAAQMIRQARGASLAAFLPEPLDGWTAEAADVQSAGAAMFGGGTTVARSYQQAGQHVTISIITDSPLLQSMLMLFSNPVLMASQGGQLQMIQGQQALVKPDGVTMVLNNTYLVQVNGGASAADFVAYAGAIDLPGLLAF